MRPFVCVLVVAIQGERHARRFVEMWMGQSMQNAWRGWCAVLQGARLRRLRVTRFVAIRRLRTLSRTLRGLSDNVVEERRTRLLIARVRARWTNACLWKVMSRPRDEDGRTPFRGGEGRGGGGGGGGGSDRARAGKEAVRARRRRPAAADRTAREEGRIAMMPPSRTHTAERRR